jgi:hypothetical protein
VPATRAAIPFAASPRKVDVVARHRDEYVATRAPQIVTTGPGRYLSIPGRGEPGGALFQTHVGALYGMAWSIKMALKARGKDFRIPPLEGLWWPASEGAAREGPGSEWNWKLLMRVPNFVRKRDLEPAVRALEAKGRAGAAGEVRIEELREGRCVQALHVGPYATEPETLDRMRRVAADLGLAFRGRHHEIYLSDPRRVAPERIRTILRMPVRAAR